MLKIRTKTNQSAPTPEDKTAGLRRRMIVVLLAAALLPLALLAFGSWKVFGDLLERKSLELMRTMVRSHARAIEGHLSERLHLLKIAAQSHSLSSIGSARRLGEVLEALNAATKGSFVDLGVIDSAGNHLAYVGPYDLEGRNYHGADWFKEVMQAGAYISDVFLGFRQVPHCIIAVKIVNGGGDPWILRATINSEQFDELVRAGVPGEGRDAYILNRDGVYQTTPKTGAVLDRSPIPKIPVHRGLEEQRVEAAGGTRLRVTTWINNKRWLLVVEQDLSAVRAPLDEAMANGALVAAVAIVVLVLTTFAATRHLTDRIDRANAERDEMSRALLRSAKLASMGELAAGLAHEINNPLAVITAEQTNIADLLAQPQDDGAQRQEMLASVERCKKQARRCASITRKMLQFGRQEESKPEPTDIRPRVIEAVALLERHGSVRNVTIAPEIADGLPEVWVDPLELEQVLVNLINNAIDALPEGGTVKIRAYRGPQGVNLEVADDGVGISPENLDRIFEPFFTTKPVGQGTGLGLSVCYGIVQSWGGSITVDSEEGQGTTIQIQLPPTLANQRGVSAGVGS